ncbi:MAG TPA: PKD domain-containing protein, partial [Chitinophagaceae bacterium]|nr:PKD domain-containing protein [Chitinophagaceae bacterium]
MRKLYAFFAGLIFCLVSNQTMATPDVAGFTYTIDATGFNVAFTNTSVLGSEPGPRYAYWNFGDGTTQTTGALDGTQHHYANAGSYTVCLRLFRYGTASNTATVTAESCVTIVIREPHPDSCSADYERIPLSATSDPLHIYLKALPWHSNDKRPVRICWRFGDGRDTCIQYSNTSPGPYVVEHNYANPGFYEVCVNILYQGGCEARKCKTLQVGHPDSCRADFERIPLSTSNNPLRAYFKALPWHNNNKKPSRVCWTFGDGRDTCINY